MPDDELEFAISRIIPVLYSGARLEHLPVKLVEKFEKLPETKGMMLWGDPGRGKSYALAAFARKFLLDGYSVQRISYEKLCLQLRNCYKPKSAESELNIIKPYLEADKLVLEDIGTTKSEGNQESDFSVRTILVLIDHRLENCLPTFTTTNRTLEELEKTFDARVASRLIQACEIIHLTGPDKRREIKP